jgi:cyclic pyranopterin phosphate synthase
MAKMLGYRQIALTTNGRMLSYRSYAAELFERGLNRVVFSIHEAEPKRHDALTRTPGSFLQSMKGLANASAMKKRYGLTIETSTVVTKRNLGRLREIYESLEAYPVDQIVFNIIKPEGRGLTHFKSLVPRYTDVRNGFEALLKEIPAAAHRALLVELPPCLPVNGTGGPAGYIEEFLMFDGEDEPALESKTVVKEAHGGTLFKSARTGQGRVKRKACAGCGSFKICWGVPLRYIEHYGWTEFMPVRGKA